MNCLIYKATNKIDGKTYIGFTTQSLDSRIKEHVKEANADSKLYFHNAIRMYGIDSFCWETIYTSKDVDFTLNIMEGYLIKESNSHWSLHGYNMTWGGDNPPKMNDVTAKKIQQTMIGRKLSEEHKKSLSSAMKGNKNQSKIVSEQTRQKLRLALTGNKNGLGNRGRASMSEVQ